MIGGSLKTSQSLGAWICLLLELWLPGFLAPIAAQTPTAGKSNLPVLSRVADIRYLSPQESQKGYPVRVVGVLTYYDAMWHSAVVQDESGGIFLDSKGQAIPVSMPNNATAKELAYGDLVEVTGVSDSGGFSPVIARPQIKYLGPGKMPAPVPISYDRMATGLDDCRWIETTGLVHTVHDATDGSLFAREHLLMTATTPGGAFKIWIPNWRQGPTPIHFIDSKIRIRGVCGVSSNYRGQYQGIDLMVPSLAEIQVLEPAPINPFDAPLYPINRLLRFSTNVIPEHRIRVTGVVTLHLPGKEIYIKDEMIGLHVQSLQTNRLEPGDRIEVIGFAGFNSSGPVLSGAQYRRLGATNPPTPIRLEASALLDGKFADELVQVEGRLLSRGRQGDTQLLMLESEHEVVNAELDCPMSTEALPADGSLVRLTGVNVVDLDPLYKWPQRFRLLLRSPADIEVLQRPPWWNARRLAIALGASSTILLVSGVWLLLLAQKNTALVKMEAVLQKANTELDQRVQERTLALSQANESLREQIEARARVEEQLRQIQKLEAVGQLAAGVAHDFNNIFSAMLLNLGMLQSDQRFGTEAHTMLTDLQSQVRRAASLTRQLLMYGQRQIIRRQVVDLNEVIGQVINVLPRVLGDRIAFEQKLQHPLPSARVDPGLIEQAIMNLIVNAKDAMPQGGKLSITSECVVIAEDAPNINPESRPGLYACIAISDTGTGMDKATMKRIFEPFFTTKDVGKGIGMGLASVYGIIKQHQGWIEVESALNQGSTFRIHLPLIKSENPPLKDKSLATHNCPPALPPN